MGGLSTGYGSWLAWGRPVFPRAGQVLGWDATTQKEQEELGKRRTERRKLEVSRLGGTAGYQAHTAAPRRMACVVQPRMRRAAYGVARSIRGTRAA